MQMRLHNSQKAGDTIEMEQGCLKVMGTEGDIEDSAQAKVGDIYILPAVLPVRGTI